MNSLHRHVNIINSWSYASSIKLTVHVVHTNVFYGSFHGGVNTVDYCLPIFGIILSNDAKLNVPSCAISPHLHPQNYLSFQNWCSSLHSAIYNFFIVGTIN